MTRRLLFFSRGRGRGHAVIDIDTGLALRKLRDDVEITFVSYGTGARTFEERGIPVIDLGLPDVNSTAATTVMAGRLIAHLSPAWVVAHEEFAALPAAKIFGMKTTMITDFFSEPGLFSTESLWFADHVLFLDRPGIFAEPPSAAGKVRYLGPQIRPFAYRRRDRLRARRELALDPHATVVSVFPGSWTESMAPLAGHLLAAFDGARLARKHLLWVAGQDASLLRDHLGSRPDVSVLEADWQIDRLMVASDLAVTKANRMTVRELATLGIRTLSVSYGLNPTDDACIAPLRSNHTIPIGELSSLSLEQRLRVTPPAPLRTRSRSCAEALAQLLV